jgi:hypothetical protein
MKNVKNIAIGAVVIIVLLTCAITLAVHTKEGERK